MRASFFTLAVLASASVRAADVPPVTRVVLYPDSAVVTRSMDVPCTDDTTTAVFANLPPGFTHDTLRAGATGNNARVEGVSLREEVRDRPYAADVEALNKQIEALQVRQLALTRQMERAQADRERAEALLKSAVPFINREAAMSPKPNTAAWAAALDQARSASDEADKLQLTAQTELRDVQRKLQDLETQRNAVNGAAPRRSYMADVVLHCEGGRVHVDLSYMTGAAHWTPAYEARADTTAGRMELTVLANVTQSTGEAWHGVDVTLSTAQAKRNAQPPKLQRLYVDFSPKEETKKVLVRRDESADHLSNAEAGEDTGGEVQAADQGVSVQLAVPGKADIAGDGHPSRLVVQKLPLEASFTYTTVPKLLPYVILRGQARNAAKFPLLPGPVSLFSRGSFFGTTQLPRVAEGDTIKLPFGIDESVQIRRTPLSEMKSEPGLLSSTRKLTYAYRIELKSSNSKPRTVELQEQIPVSEMDDVKVLIDKETTPGFTTVATDGLLTWSVALGPGATKNVDLHFTVEVPTKYDSAGL